MKPISPIKFTLATFAFTPQTAAFAAYGFSPDIPRLDGFYNVGMWLQPNSRNFPPTRSSRNVICKLCKREEKRFVTQVPHSVPE